MIQDSAETQLIIAETGTVPVSCQCTKCMDMCRRTPCLGTPADILRLVENGHIDKIGSVYWGAGLMHGIGVIPMIQLHKRKDQSCVMFIDGKCTLHEAGLKPTEGVLVNHATRPLPGKLHLTVAVALTWGAEDNFDTMIKIIDALTEYDKTQEHDTHV